MKHHFKSVIIATIIISFLVSCSKEEAVETMPPRGPVLNTGPVKFKELTISVKDMTSVGGLTFHKVYKNLIADLNTAQSRTEIYVWIVGEYKLIVPDQSLDLNEYNGTFWISISGSDLNVYFRSWISGPPPMITFKLMIYE